MTSAWIDTDKVPVVPTTEIVVVWRGIHLWGCFSTEEDAFKALAVESQGKHLEAEIVQDTLLVHISDQYAVVTYTIGTETVYAYDYERG